MKVLRVLGKSLAAVEGILFISGMLCDKKKKKIENVGNGSKVDESCCVLKATTITEKPSLSFEKHSELIRTLSALVSHRKIRKLVDTITGKEFTAADDRILISKVVDVLEACGYSVAAKERKCTTIESFLGDLMSYRFAQVFDFSPKNQRLQNSPFEYFIIRNRPYTLFLLARLSMYAPPEVLIRKIKAQADGTVCTVTAPKEGTQLFSLDNDVLHGLIAWIFDDTTLYKKTSSRMLTLFGFSDFSLSLDWESTLLFLCRCFKELYITTRFNTRKGFLEIQQNLSMSPADFYKNMEGSVSHLFAFDRFVTRMAEENPYYRPKMELNFRFESFFELPCNKKLYWLLLISFLQEPRDVTISLADKDSVSRQDTATRKRFSFVSLGMGERSSSMCSSAVLSKKYEDIMTEEDFYSLSIAKSIFSSKKLFLTVSDIEEPVAEKLSRLAKDAEESVGLKYSINTSEDFDFEPHKRIRHLTKLRNAVDEIHFLLISDSGPIRDECMEKSFGFIIRVLEGIFSGKPGGASKRLTICIATNSNKAEFVFDRLYSTVAMKQGYLSDSPGFKCQEEFSHVLNMMRGYYGKVGFSSTIMSNFTVIIISSRDKNGLELHNIEFNEHYAKAISKLAIQKIRLCNVLPEKHLLKILGNRRRDSENGCSGRRSSMQLDIDVGHCPVCYRALCTRTGKLIEKKDKLECMWKSMIESIKRLNLYSEGLTIFYNEEEIELARPEQCLSSAVEARDEPLSRVEAEVVMSAVNPEIVFRE